MNKLLDLNSPTSWGIPQIGLSAPRMFERVLGYRGKRRFVAFYTNIRTSRFGSDDGTFHPSEAKQWRKITNHLAILPFFDASRFGRCLLLDRQTRDLFVGADAQVRIFLDAATSEIAEDSHDTTSPPHLGLLSWLDAQLETGAAQYRLACWHMKMGEVIRAADAFEKAEVLSPEFANDSTFQHARGRACLAVGDYPEAIVCFERALRRKPTAPELYDGLGLALIGSGRLEDALGAFDQSVTLSPENAVAHCSSGLALAMLGRHEEAIQEYTIAATLRPEDAETHANLACSYAEIGDTPSAFAEYRLAVTLGLDIQLEHELQKRL
jgi:tetratricopeptide (TPR) repeat protein